MQKKIKLLKEKSISLKKRINMDFKMILDVIEHELQGEAHLDELARDKQDPFKILISTILSARTRDTNTREATIQLFSKYKTPQEIAKADIEDLEKDILAQLKKVVS